MPFCKPNIATPDFNFKRCSIRQDGVTHPVGTDAVLLGAWVNISSARRVLDVGTGSGVLALMMAQRTEHSADVSIDAVEIHAGSADRARQNFEASLWSERLKVWQMTVQELAESAGYTYDLIISNPPFFSEKTQAPDETRRLGRHTATLPPLELLESVKRLLSLGGRFAVVLPVQEGRRFCELAVPCGLYWTRVAEVYGRAGKPVERLLIEFERNPYLFQREALVVYQEGQHYSTDYQELTKDFYL